jgi:hypothetical protein
MQAAGFSDAEDTTTSLGSLASRQLGKLRDSILRLATAMKAGPAMKTRA